MERTWFPRQDLNDSANALLKNFIYSIGFPLSRLTIEKDTKEHPDFPALSVSTLTQVLNKWGIKTVSYTWETKKLSEMPLPSILFIEEKNSHFTAREFVILHEVNGNTLTYLHTRKGWVYEEAEEFDKKWNKAVLSITEITNPNGETDVEEKEKEYTQKKAANPDFKNISLKDNFLTDEECDHIIKLSEEKFERSVIMGKEKSLESEGRTSYSALLDLQDDAILNGIRKRASALLKMPEEHFENFQCVSYEPKQEYDCHFDTIDEGTEAGRKMVLEKGQRKYTLLAYLNDDFEGGSTYFPNIDILIQPKKRSAVLFNNIDENGQVIKAAFHAGLPVAKGRKYALNIWVRNKPCR